MTAEENKRRTRRVPDEVFNQGNLALADELFTADYIEHAPLPPVFPPGLDGLKAFVTALRAAFPDFRYTVEDEIAEGDRVVIRVTASGTQSGEFLGIPAAGKKAVWSETHIARVVDGKIVEHWVDQDRLGMLEQLGIVPTPGG